MVVTSYTNVAYKQVLKGVETLLETEFAGSVYFYLDSEYNASIAGNKPAVRLWALEPEPITRFAGNGGTSHRYPVEIMVYRSIGQRSRRVVFDEVHEVAHRIKRVLENNADYSLSAVYQWHAGEITGPDANPDRVEDVDPTPDKFSMASLEYNVTVTELFS